ncbi:MAG: hypothetical protein O7E52_20490 [Candidatus Poribacteria bacterium]|nr:hypothetical protein [Candidatus Poribacteria bacterium]
MREIAETLGGIARKELEAAKKNADIVGIDCRFVRADLLRMPKDLR